MIFLIKYSVHSTSGSLLKEGTTKAKNASNKIQAQVEFEKHMIKKFPNFGKLTVHSCTEDSISGIFDAFGDLFGKGGSNPFGF